MLRGLQVYAWGTALAASLLAGPAVALAQEPAAPQPEKPVLPLEGSAVQITVLIKPDKTADFEKVLAKYREAMEKSEKPARKQQNAGLTVYKSTQPGPNGNAVYFMLVDPVVPDEEYDISRVINEVFPSEVQDLFNLYKEAFAGSGIAPLTKVK
jgi:hypothetical protein